MFVKYFECEFPWQIQNQSISIHQGDLKIRKKIITAVCLQFSKLFFILCHQNSFVKHDVIFKVCQQEEFFSILTFCRYVYIAGLRVKY